MSNGNDLFNNLKSLGFDNLSEVDLYKAETKQTEIKSVSRTSPADFLFDRKIECPCCGKQTTVRAVKSSGVRVISRDTDFMTYYQDPNPMLYDAWVCIFCGYAALSSKFSVISDRQIRLIKENITSKWTSSKKYPAVYDIDTAIEMHQLALLNCVVKMGKDSEKAYTCLKIAWLYRLKKDDANEFKFLLQAQKGFVLTLEKEVFPVVGLDEESMEYLIGELFRRLDSDSEALKWFSRVLCNPKAKAKIKDMARDQRDLINKLRSMDQGKYIV
ncbi:MAG: DUF2225 domain-containing protein [Clostridia bacterium]|nr:DUF2225 domain-containing protein [Clostridia bacterium]